MLQEDGISIKSCIHCTMTFQRYKFSSDSIKKYAKSDSTVQHKARPLLIIFLLVCVYIALWLESNPGKKILYLSKVYSSNKGMALLNIHTFPDPLLRKKALPVTDFDQSLDNTAQSMLETMYVSSGIGLAAIQAGILKQIIVIDLKSGEEDINLREPHIFINPKILKKYGSTVSEEGCLSVIDFRGDVERAEKISVEYQDV